MACLGLKPPGIDQCGTVNLQSIKTHR